MPGRLTSLESIDAIEEIFRTGVPSIELMELSRDDAISWRDSLELQGEYWVYVSEPSEPNSFYSIKITPRKK